METEVPPELEEVEAFLWQRLQQAVDDRASSLRWASLATIDERGDPQVRTVILRGLRAESRSLFCFTDRRSPKWRELRRQPRLSLCLTCPQEQLQIRLEGAALLHQSSEISQRFFQALPAHQHRDYLSELPPGTPLTEPRPASSPEGGGAQAHFGLIEVLLRRADLLWLRRAGHRRAELLLSPEGTEARWLQP